MIREDNRQKFDLMQKVYKHDPKRYLKNNRDIKFLTFVPNVENKL